MVELKAEKQRADQREGLKAPKPDQKSPKGPEDEAKEAATGFAGWLSRNKPIAALAVICLVAVSVQALGVADVKLALADLLSPITTPLWKVIKPMWCIMHTLLVVALVVRTNNNEQSTKLRFDHSWQSRDNSPL